MKMIEVDENKLVYLIKEALRYGGTHGYYFSGSYSNRDFFYDMFQDNTLGLPDEHLSKLFFSIDEILEELKKENEDENG